MRTFLGIAALICFSVPTLIAATPSAATPGTLVIVFKDGHRQAFKLADIARVEFADVPSGSADAGTSSSVAPSRGRFLGKWVCGDGNGSDFTIRLEENGDAYRSIGDEHGKWTYVNGEAQVTWDDGAQDAIRKVGSAFKKFAYSSGKRFTDEPDNVSFARNTTPHPI